jgi:hypothetical protein
MIKRSDIYILNPMERERTHFVILAPFFFLRKKVEDRVSVVGEKLA